MTRIYIDYGEHNAVHARSIRDALAERYGSTLDVLDVGSMAEESGHISVVANSVFQVTIAIVILSAGDLAPRPGTNSDRWPGGWLTTGRDMGIRVLPVLVDASEGHPLPGVIDGSSLLRDVAYLSLSSATYDEDVGRIVDNVEVVLQIAAGSIQDDSKLWASHHPAVVQAFGEQISESEVPVALDVSGESEGIEVGWSADSPATADLLKRDTLAQVLNRRLRDAHSEDRHTSLLVHLDGAWGSGKSTVLMLLAKHLKTEPSFLLVWFDAWQQSRVSPPWWALLTTLRQHILQDMNIFQRTWLRVRELCTRARVSGAPFVFAVVMLMIVTAGVGALTFWLARMLSPSTSDLIKMFTPGLAMLAFLWAGVKVASRVFLWNSARGARLFEQSDTNPMARVAVHFEWLLRRSKKPVVFFVDDLDRCREDYVVEFLDSVHTLVRDAPRSHHAHYAKAKPHAAYFVVAADGTWIRRSYETAYKTFETSVDATGGSLGYLFMDKLFQLNVPMPSLGSGIQKEFLGNLLGVKASAVAAEVAAASAAIKEAGGNEAAIVETLDGLDSSVRQEVAGQAALALVSAEANQYVEHALRKFSPLLHGNPRSIKLFLNTYSMLRSVRTLEGGTVSPDTLALWALIRVRWPSIADFLQRAPEAVEGIKDELWCSEHFPEELRAAAKNKELRKVVSHHPGGPLSAALIRECCGTTADQDQ